MKITEKQQEVLDFISSYCKNHARSPTQREIKDHFNLKSFGSVQKYLKYLANAGYIDNDWNARRGIKIKTQGLEGEVPLLGHVAAGNPLEIIDPSEIEYIKVPLSLLKGKHQYFALKVKGDSMIEDGIFENDIAICQVASDAKNGEKVIAVINNEATIKTFFKNKDSIHLNPANACYSPIVITKDSGDFSLAGILVGLIRIYS